MLASMSRKGNCWDNATSESFFNSLKNERVRGSRYEIRDEARADLFDYIEVFFIIGVVVTPRSEASAPQQFTRHGSRFSPSPSWRPKRCRLVPENPMEGHPSKSGRKVDCPTKLDAVSSPYRCPCDWSTTRRTRSRWIPTNASSKP
jgi:Integrase core domain